MEYRLLNWNIALQSNKEYEIPDFVGEAIRNTFAGTGADIVILTEFVFCKNAKDFLKSTFADEGYDYYPKQNTNHDSQTRVNEVLIAWKKSKFKLDEEREIFRQDCTQSKDVPDFLTVPLITVPEGERFRVAGVRITMTSENNQQAKKGGRTVDYKEQAKLRYKEMEMVYSKLDDLDMLTGGQDSRILIGGDFNNYRRYTIISEWNYQKITCGRDDYTPYTPEGDSFDGNKEKNIPPAPEDHFITKNCYMKEYSYNRDFTDLDQSIYWGKSFQGLRDGVWKTIQAPNPDHAMLIGILSLEN